MELLDSLALGLAAAGTPVNLMYCLAGAILGTLIGVLPGIGPVATVAMLLPVTFKLEPLSALIMLSGIYYGAQYGGSTTAILMKLPGESSSVVTALDGYEMARHGRAGPALAIAALGSFFAGCVATLLIAVFAKPLGELALRFASKAPVSEKWEGVGWSERAGAPLLDAAIVWIGCELRDVISGGDHVIVTGEVLAVEQREGRPLVFHEGVYQALD